MKNPHFILAALFAAGWLQSQAAESAASAKKCPLAVEYPTTLAVVKAGLRDAFRTFYPDEIAHPGHTWTPTTEPTDPNDRHDRIDFVFFGGAGLAVKNCEIVGEKRGKADIIIQPYPSDHRGVAATFELPK